MVDFKGIYSSKADAYDLLVSREDYRGNIGKALDLIQPLSGLDAVDLGAGTGRMARILSPHVRRLMVLDISRHMLDKAIEGSEANWRFVQANNLNLPLREKSFNLACAGWSLGHLTGWYPDSWMDLINQCLAEMRRILTPGGTIIILETLGTGNESPLPPSEALASYYRHLEDDLGFSFSWIRTDYKFKTSQEAVELTRFFFGRDFSNKVAQKGSAKVPECTGIWSAQL